MKIIARESSSGKTKELVEMCFNDAKAMLVVPFERDKQRRYEKIAYGYQRVPTFPIVSYAELDELDTENYNLYFDDFDKVLANFNSNATYVLTIDD